MGASNLDQFPGKALNGALLRNGETAQRSLFTHMTIFIPIWVNACSIELKPLPFSSLCSFERSLPFDPISRTLRRAPPTLTGSALALSIQNSKSGGPSAKRSQILLFVRRQVYNAGSYPGIT